VKSALTAGSTFAVTVLAGFAGGLVLAHRTGAPLWAVAGLFAGVLVGGLVAARTLLQAGK
jgi:Putative F0F1-ATPase subunit Ca2+/Mg2+ transporter